MASPISGSSECIEEIETDRRDDEEVHGGNLRRVVAQEGPPSLAGWLPSFHHVLGDTRLRAPKWIVDADPPDQHAQLGVDLRSASRRSRLPAPVAEKTGPVPTHERLGPDDGKD